MQDPLPKWGASFASGLSQDFNPLQEPQLSNPYPFFVRARQEEPIFLSPSRKMVIVTRYSDVQTILKESQHFSLPLPSKDALATRYAPEVLHCLRTNILGTNPGLTFSNPVQHSRLRKVLTKVFAPRQMTDIEPQVYEVMHHLIDCIEQKGKMDFIAEFSHHYPLLVLGQLLGIPDKDREQVNTWIEDWVNLLFLRIPPERHIICAQSLCSLQQYLYDFLESHCMTPQDDLTTGLLQALEKDGAEHKILDAIELLIVLFVAGFEITENFLGLCFCYVLSNPEYWKAIQEDISLITPLVEEMLRFDSSGIGLIRQTTQEVELNGVSLPHQAMLYLALGSANHDEAHFSLPEVFALHREHLSHHIAFGYGPHYCIGAPIARLEIRIALEVLSQRLPSLRLLSKQKLMYKQHSTSLRGLKHLLVEWDIAFDRQPKQGSLLR